MKAQAKTAIAMFGGAAALSLTVGFGSVGVSPVGSGSTVTTHPSTSVAPTHPDAVAPASRRRSYGHPDRLHSRRQLLSPECNQAAGSFRDPPA